MAAPRSDPSPPAPKALPVVLHPATDSWPAAEHPPPPTQPLSFGSLVIAPSILEVYDSLADPHLAPFWVRQELLLALSDARRRRERHERQQRRREQKLLRTRFLERKESELRALSTSPRRAEEEQRTEAVQSSQSRPVTNPAGDRDRSDRFPNGETRDVHDTEARPNVPPLPTLSEKTRTQPQPKQPVDKNPRLPKPRMPSTAPGKEPSVAKLERAARPLVPPMPAIDTVSTSSRSPAATKRNNTAPLYPRDAKCVTSVPQRTTPTKEKETDPPGVEEHQAPRKPNESSVAPTPKTKSTRGSATGPQNIEPKTAAKRALPTSPQSDGHCALKPPAPAPPKHARPPPRTKENKKTPERLQLTTTAPREYSPERLAGDLADDVLHTALAAVQAVPQHCPTS